MTPTIRLGSDFSGLDTAYWAMRCLKVPFRHVFACDSGSASLKILRYLQPEMIYTDVRTRQAHEVPEVDLFSFGAPWQPYSRLGKRKGANCEEGQLALFSLAYILHRKPKMVFMEQVLDVASEEDFMQLLITELHQSGY